MKRFGNKCWSRAILSPNEVSQRLGVSAHSLYKWVKAVKLNKSDEQATELVEAKNEIFTLRAQNVGFKKSTII